MPAFLEKFSGNTTKLWSASKKNGAPHTIIVAVAGIRAADLARYMKHFRAFEDFQLTCSRVVRKFHTKDAKVAKLFGKHIKMQDAIKFLKSTRTGIAVGTPARIKDLLDDGSSPNAVMAENIADFLTGALATDRLERIVIDCSYIDQKKKGILETKETQIALIQLLGEKQLRERYNSDSGSIDLLFY